MFNCKGCELLRDEVKHLREVNQKLTDRIVAITSPSAYGAINQDGYNPNDYYGSDGDEFVEYDQFGQKVLCRKDPIVKS